MSESSSRKSLVAQPAFWIAIAIVTVVAFTLGALLSGGNSGANEGDVAAETVSTPEAWTCSMHPQIQLPKEGKCPICFMDLIPVGAGGSDDLGPRQIRMSESSMQLAQIAVSRVVRANAQHQIRLFGRLAVDETRLSRISARVGGRIDRLYINTTGQEVKHGATMLELYSPELLSAQKELIAAKASLAGVAQSNSDILISTAESNVRAAVEKLRLLGFTNEQITGIETQSDVSEHLAVKATGNGVVLEKMVVEGQYVEPGMDLFRIADLSKLWAVFEAYESEISFLNLGDDIRFVAESSPGEEFSAKINFINPTLDPMTRTVQVRAIVDNSKGQLKPETFATAIINTAVASGSDLSGQSLLVPATAVLFTGTRAVVYLQLPNDEGPLFEGREITIGQRVGDYYIVIEGLSEGDMVVTNGAFRLDSELQIQAKPSMMSAPESAVLSPRNDSHEHDDAESDKGIAISVAARNALTPLYNDYFKFQMALADDNLDNSRTHAAQLERTITEVDISLFSGSSHDRWMELAAKMKKSSEIAAKAGDIVGARDAFFHLSNAVIELHNAFGHDADMNYYLTFCPMARDNKGAYWLQTVDTVYNSFYGDMMLRCGEIKQALKPEN